MVSLSLKRINQVCLIPRNASRVSSADFAGGEMELH